MTIKLWDSNVGWMAPIVQVHILSFVACVSPLNTSDDSPSSFI